MTKVKLVSTKVTFVYKSETCRDKSEFCTQKWINNSDFCLQSLIMYNKNDFCVDKSDFEYKMKNVPFGAP